MLQDAGATVHLAHPLGVKGFTYRRVKNDVRDAADLADLLRMGRLPEAYVAPPQVRELRELVRHRATLVALRSGLKAGVHAVLAKQSVHLAVTDLFGVGGRVLLFMVDAARTLRRPQQDHDNPWRAGTLEWLPPREYGVRSIPQVDSRYPLWRQPALPQEVEA